MEPLYVISPFLDAEIERLQKLELDAEQAQLQLAFETNRASAAAKDYMPSPPFGGRMEGLLAGILYGGIVLGYQQIDVTATTAVSLTVPDKAKKAIIIVEADPTTGNKTQVVRYQSGENANPTATVGIAIGDKGAFDIGLLWNLKRAKFIGIEAGKTHKLIVEYQG
jgi:hypothetical protein